MSLPVVDFDRIASVAQEALALYGSPVTFTEQGAPAGRTVRAVIYRDTDPAHLVQDVNTEPAKALLSPADFLPPNRQPQQFDTITAAIDGFVRIYTIADVHPVLAANRLPLLIATIRGS